MAASARAPRPRALLQKWLSLPLSQKLIVNHVLVVAVFVEATIRGVRVSRLARWLGVSFIETDGSGLNVEGHPDFRPKELHQARLTVEVMEHWPFAEGTCLRQALVVGHFLRRHHPTLRIGVRKDGGDISTHAWIEVGDSSVGLDHSFLPFRKTR